MDEHQVDVIAAQLAQGFVDGRGGLFLAGVGNPHLGGDEHLVAAQAAVAQGLTHAFLVAVGLGRINQAIAHGKGVAHAAARLRRVHLVNAVAQHGHFYAVVQRCKFHCIASFYL